MRKFIGWIGTIAATVIAALLIYWFTPRAKTFEGMVIDRAQNVPVKQAMVIFEVEPSSPGNGPYHDFTDENGSYKMDVSHLPSGARVKLHAQAHGFHDSAAVNVASIQDDNRNDFMLAPLPTPEQPQPGPTPGATPHPTVTINPGIRLRYVPKAVPQKFDLKPLK